MPFTDFDWFTGMYVTEDLMNKELDDRRYNRSLASIKPWANQKGSLHTSVPAASARDVFVRVGSIIVSDSISSGTYYFPNVDITALASGRKFLVYGSVVPPAGEEDIGGSFVFLTDENARYLTVAITVVTSGGTGQRVSTITSLFFMTHRDPVSW